MDTLKYLESKFELDLNRKPPIEIVKINRVIMAQTLYELGFRTGAEIGVAKGEHAGVLCANNPDLLLYCIDPWRGYDGYNDYSDRRLNQFYTWATMNLQGYNCKFVRKFSMDAVKDFKDGSLDFVYIDGAHDFKNVADDICEWSKKVRPGGILFGHDFKRSPDKNFQCHVQDVVSAYAYSHRINPWFILGQLGRHDGMYKEGTRSWGWVCS